MGKKYHTNLTAKEKKALKLKGINIEKVKKEILQQLHTKEEDNYTQINNNNNQYEYKYQEYLNYSFNSRSVAMIVSFMNKTKLFPENLKKTQKFLINLIQIIKKLMMNEIEITLFTLNIDSYDWKNNNLNHELCLFFLGLYTKQITNKDCSLFFSIFRKENIKIIENYKIWEKVLKKDIFRIDIINKRFRELNKPYNTYCKADYIDYNGVVDIIYKLSQPYGEENKGGKIKVREENNIEKNISDNNIIGLMNYNFDNEKNINLNPIISLDNEINNYIRKNNLNFLKNEPSIFGNNFLMKQNSNFSKDENQLFNFLDPFFNLNKDKSDNL
jgi:hypothetical protein